MTLTPSVGGAAGTLTTLHLTLDTTAPTVSVTAPTAGSVVSETLTFTGTASDGLAGLARVEVSMDGGTTWRRAVLDGGAWSLEWEVPLHQDYATYPAQVRAVDRAGNVTVVANPVAEDNVPPTDVTPVTFTIPVGREVTAGQHLEKGTLLTANWQRPGDGSGIAEVLVTWGYGPEDRFPTYAPPGTSDTIELSTAGGGINWLHIATRDAAGNVMLTHYGPWYVRDMANSSFEWRRQSIVLDGYIDLAHDEWQSTDLLGIDTRSGNPQALYATWDGQAVYLGWSGAWWTLDGVLWAYLDTKTEAGTATTKDGAALPVGLYADQAVEIRGPGDGALWTWNGSAWVKGPLAFATGPSGDTEVRVPWPVTPTNSQPLNLVAFALSPEAEQTVSGQMIAMSGGMTLQAAGPTISPWAIFPSTNPLSSTVTQDFGWTDLGTVTQVNQDQPTALTVPMDVSSPQATGTAWGPGTTLEYRIRITNAEPAAVSGLNLALAATTGLTYATQDGGNCTNCPADGSGWTLGVPTLQAGGSAIITVTGTLDGSLTGLRAVTSTFALSTGTAIGLTPESHALATVTHRVDAQAPTVTIDANGGSSIGTGGITFTGRAVDLAADGGTGSGVANVEVVVGDLTWTMATGTQVWSFATYVPVGMTEVTLQARATDNAGNTSVAIERTFAVDTTAPEVTLTAPAVTTSTLTAISGSTNDPVPENALVKRVEVQLDATTGPWRTATGPFLPTDGTQGWVWTWVTPQEDAVTHNVRARATDAAGNVTATDWQQIVVDTVAPQITVTQHLSTFQLPNDPDTRPPTSVTDPFDPFDPFPPPSQDVTVYVYLPLVLRGNRPESPSANVQRDPSASVTMPEPVSSAAAEAQALLAGTVGDGAGVTAVRILIYDPLGGLTTAEVALTGDTWSYAPDLTAWAVGTYALRVQALDAHANARLAGPFRLDITDGPIEGLEATDNGPRSVGETVTFTATIGAGSNVSYTWDFGDGVIGSGRVAAHPYEGSGEYTATVTATNSVSTMGATTDVTIEP